MFRLAEERKTAGSVADAEAIYRALAADPDIDVRAEARFRHALLIARNKRYREAAVLLRAVLDERPGAVRIRLELARILALLGDERAARRELRQARAAPLPPEVRLIVDQFSNALRSAKRVGGSIAVSLMPDSNANRATRSQTLDTVIAPLTLSRDARAQSGLGFNVTSQGYWRIPIDPGLSILPRLSANVLKYRDGSFDDVSGAGLIGLEWRTGRSQFNVSAGGAQRWYGGNRYSTTLSGSVDWLRTVGQRTEIGASGSIARARYSQIPQQNGPLYQLSFRLDRALSTRTAMSLSSAAFRQTAVDRGYAYWSGAGTVLLSRNLGRADLFISVGRRALAADKRLLLFTRRRRDQTWTLGAGATLRRFTIASLAPLVRIDFERNRSTIELYDYRRVATQIGLVGAF